MDRLIRGCLRWEATSKHGKKENSDERSNRLKIYDAILESHKVKPNCSRQIFLKSLTCGETPEGKHQSWVMYCCVNCLYLCLHLVEKDVRCGWESYNPFRGSLKCEFRASLQAKTSQIVIKISPTPPWIRTLCQHYIEYYVIKIRFQPLD